LPEGQAKALAEVAQSFEEEFPYFKITLHHYDNPKDFMTPLVTGETQFDVVLVSPALLGSLWAAEQIAPMSDFFAPNFMDSFAAVTLQGASRDGEVWGLPDTAGFHLLLFYNRDLVDAPPADTEQFVKLAERPGQRGQGQEKDSRHILGVNSYDPLWVVPWLSAYGGWLTSEVDRPTLNTPAMQEALALFKAWHDSAEGIAAMTSYDEMRSQFLAGNLAMIIDGDWAIGELARVARIDWGVAPLPDVVITGEGRQAAAPLVLARYWAVSRSTSGDRALAAASFLEYLTRPERQLDRATHFGLLPTRREALDDPMIVNDPILRTSAEQMLAGRAVPLGVNADALLNSMREPLRQVLDGQVTPEQAAEMMQVNAER
jgi:ABC-type glycerol-3-phosphate transport system substrate-binding protein